MAQTESSRIDDVREVLINAVEVELAALNAAVSFWRQWVNHTSDYVTATTRSLGSIRSADKDVNQVLLEMVDASRQTARTMTELPRKAAEDFLRELEAVQRTTAPSGTRPAAKRRARTKP
jgi:hypothetical protein